MAASRWLLGLSYLRIWSKIFMVIMVCLVHFDDSGAKVVAPVRASLSCMSSMSHHRPCRMCQTQMPQT